MVFWGLLSTFEPLVLHSNGCWHRALWHRTYQIYWSIIKWLKTRRSFRIYDLRYKCEKFWISTKSKKHYIKKSIIKKISSLINLLSNSNHINNIFCHKIYYFKGIVMLKILLHQIFDWISLNFLSSTSSVILI